MSRVALGRLLLACLLVTCVAIGQAAAESKPAKKHAHKGGKEAQRREEGIRRFGGFDRQDARRIRKEGRRKETGDEKNRLPTRRPPPSRQRRKLKKGPFRIEVALDGVFEAQNQAELFVRPQEWAALSVLKAVEHGTVVKQGDLVLALDTEKIDRVIADLRSELELNELALKQAAAQLAAMEKIAPLDDQANDRSRRITEEDWKRFQEVDKPLMAKVTEYPLEGGPGNAGICRGGISSTRKDV